MEPETMETRLKTAAREFGADLVGIADLAPFASEPCGLPPATFQQFSNAVSIAVHLDDEVIDAIDGAPTPEYAELYRAVNSRLDGLTAQIAAWVSEQGFDASPIPSSQMANPAELMGTISHKAVARMAGIGWQGKSLLIVSPQFGPRIRLATVLTNLPLSPDAPLKNRCGKCTQCTKACPASAIKNVSTLDRYKSRDEALHLQRCLEQTLQFKSRPDIQAQVCGVCVKVCPFGKLGRKSENLRV